MRRLVLVASLMVAACKPDLGAPGSLVTGPRVLAIRGTPPEVRPGTPDSGVVYELLAVTPTGTITSGQPSWSYCVAPTPPSDNNLVSPDCLGPNAKLEGIASDGLDGLSPVPDNACSVFGPFPPMLTDAGTGRPPDADGTGGYYQPVRVDIAGADGGDLPTFGEERIQCGLPNVTIEVANGFKAYTLNQNPVLTGVAAAVGAGNSQILTFPDAGGGTAVAPGSSVTLSANWPAAAAESFPVLDPVSRALVTQRENLITSWFVTGGTMAFDEVEVAGSDTSTTATNQWTAPMTPGPVHLWVVLRDSRGGVDFGEFLVVVE